MFVVGETDLVMEELNKSEEENRKIEEATQDQYLCDKWYAERKTRLTSSRFGLICKRKKAVTKKFCQKLVEGRDLRKVPAVAYGLAHEAVALERFRIQMGFEVVRKAMTKVVLRTKLVPTQNQITWRIINPLFQKE